MYFVNLEDISRLVECMALNSTTSSEGEGSQVSEIDSFLIEGKITNKK